MIVDRFSDEDNVIVERVRLVGDRNLIRECYRRHRHRHGPYTARLLTNAIWCEGVES